ncbi:hypothetical protein ACFL2D_00570 [Patescibacteria group bacterium]
MNLGTVKTGKPYTKILIGFSALAVILVGVVVYFSFSSATISITPKALVQEVSFDASISQDPNLDPREIETISGRIITVETDGSKDISSVSKKTIEEKARGEVILHNDTPESQPLLPSTQMTNTDDVKFLTDERANVPAGGTVAVGATAALPGASGNIEPGRLTIIKLFKGLQDDIYGEVKKPMKGGIRKIQMVDEHDIDEAKNSLAEELYRSLIGKVEKQTSDNERFLKDAVKKEVLEFKSSVDAGAEVDSFGVNLKARVTAVVFDEDSLMELAISKLQAEIPSGRELVNYTQDDISYSVKSYDINAGTAELRVTFHGTTILKLSNEIFDKTKIFGLSETEAIDYFLQYPDIRKVEIELSPFWVSKIPNIEGKIDINIAENIDINEQKEQEEKEKKKKNKAPAESAPENSDEAAPSGE